MNNKNLFLLILMAVFLTACASNITVTPKYEASQKENTSLASLPTTKFKLGNFEDRRAQKAEPILVGHREAAFGMPMGDIFSKHPIFEVVRNTVKNELIGNGHTIVNNNENITIKGKINKFWVRTDVTALYWDLVGEVSITIEVSSPARKTPTVLGPYSGKNVERTYLNPSQELATLVLDRSLGDAMRAMSADPKLARAIRSRR